MLQIIGFLLCAMLAVKLLEMTGNSALRDESGKTRDSVTFGILMGWAAVFGFAFWLLAQGGAFEPRPSELDRLTAQADEAQRKADCMEDRSPDLDAMLAC
jgi:hypothetical protein